MKNAPKLYGYCKENLHTKVWQVTRKREAMLCLRAEVPRYNELYYNSWLIKYDYTNDLWLTLKYECNEPSYTEDVFLAVNMLFQEIADELAKELLC